MLNRTDKTKAGQAVHEASKSNAAQNRRNNTLGLTTQELNSVHTKLDAESGADVSHKRQSARLSFHRDSIGVEIIQPGGAPSAFNVACRNLSRSGLGFLHSAYLHIGTAVTVTLARDDGSTSRVAGKIVRCRHIVRHIHEVGVRFDHAVDVRNFVAADLTNRTFTCEVVDPSQLKGTVLIAAEYRIEQACVQSMLRDTSMDFVGATSIAEAIEQARKGVHIIICDDVFKDGTGAQFVEQARKIGVRCPIIIMSGDQSETSLQKIRKADADAFLSKPIEQDQLLRAFAEFLLHCSDGAGAAGPIYSSLPPDSPMSDLVDSFVADLRTLTDEIEKHAKSHDLAGVRSRCLRIGGTATCLGFAPVTALANAVVATMDRSGGLDEAIVELNTFLSACRSTRKAAKPGPAQHPGAAQAA